MTRATQGSAMPRDAARKGLSPAAAALSSDVPLASRRATTRPYYPREAGTSRVWAAPRSLATTGGIIRLFSSPRGTKMFQFPRFASAKKRMTGLQPDGLSHSETRGSTAICAYPRIIAAYHVLHRL